METENSENLLDQDSVVYRRAEFSKRSYLSQQEFFDINENYELRDNRYIGNNINNQYLSNHNESNFFETIENNENYDINNGYLEPLSFNNDQNNNVAISEVQNESVVNTTDNIREGNNEENVIKSKSTETILYFQPKIRNSGFWGKVKLRKGTWLVIFGLILFIIAIVLIGVFWGLWFGHSINYPIRIVAITFLCMSIICFICGMLSNTLMAFNSQYKHILGSPIRKCSYVLLVSIFLLITAAALMTSYYTYWHNRWVNTPLIIVSITFFIVGGIAFYFAIRHNCIQFLKYKYEMFEAEPESLKFQKKSIYNDIMLEKRFYDSYKTIKQNELKTEK